MHKKRTNWQGLVNGSGKEGVAGIPLNRECCCVVGLLLFSGIILYVHSFGNC